MNQNAQNGERHDDEISIWELVEGLKSNWRWWGIGAILGLMGAIGFLLLVPPKYEATAVIQPSVTITSVESVAQTLERLKIVTFYGDDVVKTCQADSAKELADGVKASVVKGNNLLSIEYRTNSAELAEVCVAKIVEKLAASQEAIIAPLMKELEGQLAFTKQKIDEVEAILAQNEKQLANSPVSNESVLIILKREELMSLQKQYRDQRIQLTEPLTRSMKLLEPIYVPEKVVFPKRIPTVLGGFIGGIFVGVFSLLFNRSSRRYKLKQSS